MILLIFRLTREREQLGCLASGIKNGTVAYELTAHSNLIHVEESALEV